MDISTYTVALQQQLNAVKALACVMNPTTDEKMALRVAVEDLSRTVKDAYFFLLETDDAG